MTSMVWLLVAHMVGQPYTVPFEKVISDRAYESAATCDRYRDLLNRYEGHRFFFDCRAFTVIPE